MLCLLDPIHTRLPQLHPPTLNQHASKLTLDLTFLANRARVVVLYACAWQALQEKVQSEMEAMRTMGQQVCTMLVTDCLAVRQILNQSCTHLVLVHTYNCNPKVCLLTLLATISLLGVGQVQP